MKKYIAVPAILSVVFLLATSCLDNKLVDRVNMDDYYKTEDQANIAIRGVYSTLTQFAYHKTNWPLVLTGFEDAMFVDEQGSAVPASISNNTLTSSTPPVANFWGTLYAGIDAANEILERVPAIAFQNEDDKSRILAEAHFLRGLFHYDLVRLYGGDDGIPLIVKPVSSIDDAYQPSTPVSDVYGSIDADGSIISDLEYAAGLNDDGTSRLPYYKSQQAEIGRATNGAARALLAEVYLTIGNYDKAIENADNVINSNVYRLLDNYADLWNIDKKTESYDEHIFFVPFFRDGDALQDVSLGSNIAYFYCPNGINEDGTNLCGNPYGKGENHCRVQKWFIRYFQDDQGGLGYSDGTKDASLANLIYKDYRIETSFFRGFLLTDNATGEVTGSASAYPASGGRAWGYIKKYIDPKGLFNRTNGNDMPRLRLSDMYLIEAEAYNELGNYDEACKAIDKVRERARRANGTARAWPKYIGANNADNIGKTLNKDDFRWLVFMERGLEFAGEQHRWFDLKRMRYNDVTMMYNYMMNTFIPSRPTADVQTAGVMAERKKNLPKPYAEVSRNPGVSQNPGY